MRPGPCECPSHKTEKELPIANLVDPATYQMHSTHHARGVWPEAGKKGCVGQGTPSLLQSSAIGLCASMPTGAPAACRLACNKPNLRTCSRRASGALQSVRVSVVTCWGLPVTCWGLHCHMLGPAQHNFGAPAAKCWGHVARHTWADGLSFRSTSSSCCACASLTRSPLFMTSTLAYSTCSVVVQQSQG